MVLIQKLEIETADLFKQKQYSKVIFEITSETKQEERSAFLCNLLGLSRIANNKNNKEFLIFINHQKIFVLIIGQSILLWLWFIEG